MEIFQEGRKEFNFSGPIHGFHWIPCQHTHALISLVRHPVQRDAVMFQLFQFPWATPTTAPSNSTACKASRATWLLNSNSNDSFSCSQVNTPRRLGKFTWLLFWLYRVLQAYEYVSSRHRLISRFANVSYCSLVGGILSYPTTFSIQLKMSL